MATGSWEELLQTLTVGRRVWKRGQSHYVVRPCKPSPVSLDRLVRFEEESGVRLPRGYRQFCQTFGPGELSHSFTITVPGGKSRFDLAELNRLYHAAILEQNSPDPLQYARAVVFASDSATACYFWDPADSTDKKAPEYGIYVRFRGDTTQRVADNFWDFITDCILGPGHVKLYDDPPERLFEPGTK